MAPAGHDHPRCIRAGLPDGAMLFDPELAGDARASLLQPQAMGADPQGEAGRGGRGAVWYVQAPCGAAVLRHYRRGGAVARLSRDRYLFHGEGRTRPFREFLLLQRLHAMGLPVPRPIAAGYRRRGPFYRADILTCRIADAHTLAERLRGGWLAAEAWRAIGAMLARFHEAGAQHADLNAHNVLLDGSGRVWLIDFDRGALRAPGRWRLANLQRLQRSLHKLAASSGTAFDAHGWQALLDAYRETRP